MKDLEIREYKKSDWISVSRIHDQSRPIELQGSCDARAFIPLAEYCKDLKNFNESRKYVAIFKGDVVGFTGLLENLVSWLYVDPEYFGRGIGRCLLEHALSLIDGIPHLSVLSKNMAAIQLYQSVGFVEVSRKNVKLNGYKCSVLKLEKSR